jgi:hypothetical protein
MFFIWFGFTLLLPLFPLCWYAVPAAETEMIKIFKTLFVVYCPIYTILCWLIFLGFYKDVLVFFKNMTQGKVLDDMDREETEIM